MLSKNNKRSHVYVPPPFPYNPTHVNLPDKTVSLPSVRLVYEGPPKAWNIITWVLCILGLITPYAIALGSVYYRNNYY